MTGQARTARLHRALQSDLPGRRALRLALHVAPGTVGNQQRPAAAVQHRAAPRQPRPGATGHLLAGPHGRLEVQFRTAYWTGGLRSDTPCSERHRGKWLVIIPLAAPPESQSRTLSSDAIKPIQYDKNVVTQQVVTKADGFDRRPVALSLLA